MSIRKIIWNDLLLTGLKIDKFKYEILLPASYYMVYSGFESDGLKHMNCDIDYDIINSDKFNGNISIINMNLRPTGELGAIDFYENTEEDRIRGINLYKRVSACGNVIIYFDENKNVENVLTTYTTMISIGKSRMNYTDERMLLFDHSYPTEDFIVKEQY